MGRIIYSQILIFTFVFSVLFHFTIVPSSVFASCTINWQICHPIGGCAPPESMPTDETSMTQTAAEEFIEFYFSSPFVFERQTSPTSCNAEYCSASGYSYELYDPSMECIYEIRVFYNGDMAGTYGFIIGGLCLPSTNKNWEVDCCYESGMTSESWCGQTYDGESFNPDQCCSGICGQTGPEWYEIQCIDGASALGPGACDWESDWAVYNGYTDDNSVCCNGTVVTGNICDPDGDGVNIDTDNCPDNCNPDQLDADGDNIGDVCDSTPGCDGTTCGVSQPACETTCS